MLYYVVSELDYYQPNHGLYKLHSTHHAALEAAKAGDYIHAVNVTTYLAKPGGLVLGRLDDDS